MASITISRGTPFSAASWVMAVTNSLFMLACPPLLPCVSSIEAPRGGPHNKRSGGYPLLSVASAGSVWPCHHGVYHRVTGRLRAFSVWIGPFAARLYEG